MSQHFSTHDGTAIVADLVSVIVANREYLSEVDVPLATATTVSTWPRALPIAAAVSKAVN